MAGADRKSDQPQEGGLSRRAWLLNLGSAVVLSGFRGFPDGRPEEPAAGALPPGLYGPSLDHLNHALAGAQGPLPFPPGSQTEYVRPRSGPFLPQAFSSEEYGQLRRLVEILLGEDVPGGSHTSDEVSEWIDLVVSRAAATRAAAKKLTPELRSLAVAYFGDEEPVRLLETFAPEQICKDGFAWLNEASRERTGKGFVEADRAVQAELIGSIGDAATHAARNHPGERLFDFLKPEVIRGYYTSRAGLEELGYIVPFYGSSPACSL